jgi:hypothetical protein
MLAATSERCVLANRANTVRGHHNAKAFLPLCCANRFHLLPSIAGLSELTLNSLAKKFIRVKPLPRVNMWLRGGCGP